MEEEERQMRERKSDGIGRETDEGKRIRWKRKRDR